MKQEPPLAGILVLDLSMAQAGPIVGWFLAGLGATVVKVERPPLAGEAPRGGKELGGIYPDGEPGERPWNRDGVFNLIQSNRKSLAMRLDQSDGLELFRSLACKADVLIENFSARVMSNLGLDFPALSALNPGLIYASIKAQGLSGPKSHYSGFFGTVAAEAGLSGIWKQSPPDAPPPAAFPAADVAAALWATSLVLRALLERRTSGAGQLVDISMNDAVLGVLDDFLVHAQTAPPGWPHSSAPDPGYTVRCADGGSIVVSSDDLATACERGSIQGAGPAGSFEEIRRTVESHARARTTSSMKDLLSAWHVRSSTIVMLPELTETGVLRKDFWAEVDHPEVGLRRQPRLPFDLEPEVALPMNAAPLFAEHSREILQTILGIAPERVEELQVLGVIRQD